MEEGRPCAGERRRSTFTRRSNAAPFLQPVRIEQHPFPCDNSDFLSQSSAHALRGSYWPCCNIVPGRRVALFTSQ